MKNIINYLKKKDRCWNFFNVSRTHVLKAVEEIRKIIININAKGYSELSDLIVISNALDIIENQMPKKRLNHE